MLKINVDVIFRFWKNITNFKRMSFTIIPGSSNNFLKQAIISRPSILRCGLCSCTNVSKFLDTTCKVLAMLVLF